MLCDPGAEMTSAGVKLRENWKPLRPLRLKLATPPLICPLPLEIVWQLLLSGVCCSSRTVTGPLPLIRIRTDGVPLKPTVSVANGMA